MDFRPNTLNGLIGQPKAKERLKISIKACKESNQVLNHVLITSAPGQGKSTIALAIANELNKPIEIINGANLRSIKGLLPCLARVSYGSVLFCDEIHKASNLVQTYLLTVVEQFRYTLGQDKDSITIELPEFTFIGATTNIGGLLHPLVNRFTYVIPLEPYSIDDLAQIISSGAKKLGLDIPENCTKIIAMASRGTPRTALNRLIWVRDYAVANNVVVEPNTIVRAFNLIGLELDGTEPDDRKYLDKLKKIQPASLNTLGSALNTDPENIEKYIEPFLIERGLIRKTRRGRILC